MSIEENLELSLKRYGYTLNQEPSIVDNLLALLDIVALKEYKNGFDDGYESCYNDHGPSES